ncbi:MAG: hypothetical protein ACRCWF_18675 [Beijerinckiaceae bacterium]
MRHSIKTLVAAAALVAGVASANAQQAAPSTLENVSAVSQFQTLETTTFASALLNAGRSKAVPAPAVNNAQSANDPARGINSGR